MRIGIDFDNTIAGYGGVFGTVARAMGLIEDAAGCTKTEIRDALRGRGDDGEHDWQRLQGQVYGKYMERAELIAGVDVFLGICRDKEATVFIVSHKTEFGHHDPDRINLRDAALAWMADKNFFAPDGFAIPEENVFFEATRTEKVARIKALNCTHFIDDLEEIFLQPDFPEITQQFLLGPGTSWHAITEAVFDALSGSTDG